MGLNRLTFWNLPHQMEGDYQDELVAYVEDNCDEVHRTLAPTVIPVTLKSFSWPQLCSL